MKKWNCTTLLSAGAVACLLATPLLGSDDPSNPRSTKNRVDGQSLLTNTLGGPSGNVATDLSGSPARHDIVNEGGPAGGLVYDNGGPNGVNGLSHVQINGGDDRVIVDDFVLGAGTLVTGVRMSGVWNLGSGAPGPLTNLRVRFWNADGAAPEVGAPILDEFVPFTATNTGNTFFGRPEVAYEADISGIALNGGTTYWVSIQPAGTTDNFFHLTSANGAGITGAQVHLWWQGAPAIPQWTPGFPAVFGEPYDVTFQLFAGEFEAEGACCLGEGADECAIMSPEACSKADGNYLGNFTSCANCPATVVCPDEGTPCGGCLGDLNNSNAVDVQDLLILLQSWGPCPGCCADLNNSGAVDVQDLLILLQNWGPCPAGDGGDDVFQEPEACGDDNNGGCNATPPAYTPIKCGQTVCGTAWADNGTRDTDWYTTTIDESMTLSWTVHAEFPALAIILNDQCGEALAVIASGTAQPGIPFTIEACVQPGTYRLFVAVSDFDGVPCGTDNNYVASLSCTPCVILGACCFDSGENCNELTIADCNNIGGIYMGDNTECSQINCPADCPLGEHNENEPCGEDHNGGCNNTPPLYGQICCGDVKHGNAWANGGTRDTDWFLFTVDEDNTCVQLLLEYDFGGLGALLILLTDQCGGPLVADSVEIGPNARLISTVVDAGNYVVALATDVFEGLPCPGGTYTLSLDCSEAPCATDGLICQNAIPLGVNDAPVVVNNDGYPASAPSCGGFGPNDGTVWFSVMGDGTILTARSCGSSVAGTVVTVYCAICSNPVCIDGSNQDVTEECGNPFHGSVQWCSENGVEYLIAVRHQGANFGDLSMQVTSDSQTCNFPPDCPSPPPNNACSGAIDITGSIGQGPVLYNNLFADPAAGDPDVPAGSPSCHWNNNPGQIHHTLWFTFQAPAGGTIQVQTCAPPPGGYVDSVLAIYEGSCGNFTELGCGEDDCGPDGFLSDATVTGLTPGQTYYIMVANSGDWAGWNPGDFFLEINTAAPPPPPPANDECADAISIGSGNVGPIAWNNDNATSNPANGNTCDQFGDSPTIYQDIWFTWTATTTGNATVSTCGTTFDNKMAMYTMGCPTSMGTMIACNDDLCGSQAEFNVAVNAGTTYLIRIGSWGPATDTGAGTLSVSGQ